MAHNQAFHRRTTLVNGPSTSPPTASPPNGGAFAPGSFSAMMAAQAQSPSAYAHATIEASSPTAPGAIPIPGSRPRKHSAGGLTQHMPKLLTPFNTSSIRILLLEAVSQLAVDQLQKQGYQVDYHKDAWSEEQLVEKIADYHVIGIRSKTKLTEKVFKAADKLLAVGCFCIGTNQVRASAKQTFCFSFSMLTTFNPSLRHRSTS